MRQISFTFLLISTLMLWLTSCDTACKDVDCGNGKCVEGFCICNFGFESVACSSRTIDKFEGTYTVSEDCDSTVYGLSVTPDPDDETKLYVVGLHATSGIILDATLLGETSFRIDSQIVLNQTFSGTAIWSATDGDLSIEYFYSDSTGDLNCIANAVAD